MNQRVPKRVPPPIPETCTAAYFNCRPNPSCDRECEKRGKKCSRQGAKLAKVNPCFLSVPGAFACVIDFFYKIALI